MKTRLLFGFVALAALTSCVKDPKTVIASHDHEKFIRDKAQYEPIVEKDYWVRMPVSLCTTPAKNPQGDCIVLAVTTKLQPDGIEEGTFGDPYYHVKLADGRTGYVDAFQFKWQTTDVDLEKAEADCRRRGDPRVGMTRKQVEATCWGTPSRVDRGETARGVSERYVYGKSRFVLLHNGIVTSVQVSGRLR